jgi:hypothetical protein
VSTAVKYEIVTVTPAGNERLHEFTTQEELGPGAVVLVEGRHWLVDRVAPAGDAARSRAFTQPARYRLRLRHPDGREEAGAFRRFRPGAPRLGHSFTTMEHGSPVNWQVVDEQLARDAEGAPYLDLVAQRDYSDVEGLPDHELEHARVAPEWDLPAAADEKFARAEQAGYAVELAALDPGEAPDWAEARAYMDALVLDEIEDDLLELCGVNPDRDPRDSWLDTVKERLRSDLERFRENIEGDHDEIEEWDFREGRIFASVGSFDDEADPDSGHGWMCRLLDSSVLAAAGFARIRKAQLNSSGA